MYTNIGREKFDVTTNHFLINMLFFLVASKCRFFGWIHLQFIYNFMRKWMKAVPFHDFQSRWISVNNYSKKMHSWNFMVFSQKNCGNKTWTSKRSIVWLKSDKLVCQKIVLTDRTILMKRTLSDAKILCISLISFAYLQREPEKWQPEIRFTQ